MPVLQKPEGPSHELPHARFTALASPSRGSSETCVWRVEIAAGAPATPHELTREELFVVLSGHARVSFGAVTSEARAGDVIVVPPNTPFELIALGDSPVEALCCFPVGGRARLLDGSAPFVPPWAE